MPLQCKYNIDTVDRYYKSKFGTIVTDYYSTDAKHNIVQLVEDETLQEKVFEYADREVELTNAYEYKTKILFDKLKIVLRVQRCNDKYYLIGQYFGYGCRRIQPMLNRWYNTEIRYTQMGFYGNPIAEYIKRDINWDDFDKSDAYKDFYTNDKDFYKREQVETFVWIPIKEVEAQYEISELNDDDLALLLMDIVGVAG